MLLNFKKSSKLLQKYKIDLVDTKIVRSQKETFFFFEKTKKPLVLKIDSTKVLHKTDIGGVILNIQNKAQLKEAFEKIKKVAQRYKGEVIAQPQVSGIELIVGGKKDPLFGPIIMFGLGGIFVEVFRDVAFRLAPITKKEAREMIREIKGFEILKGARGKEGINIEKLAEILVNLSNLISQESNISEVDLNPVIANKKEAWVVDTKVITQNSKVKSQNYSLKVKTDIKKLKKIFNPKTVAIIGATDRLGSVGRGVCKNLFEGRTKRKIYFVNPYKEKVFDQKTYPKITDIKEKIDLAIIAVPAKIVPEVAKDCVKKEVGGVIIISAGFAEIGKEGEKLQKEIEKIFKEKGIPLIGPNCLGVIRPKAKLNATFAPATPKKGEIAFFSQSGALIDSVIDQFANTNLGFSLIVSYGNEAGLTLCDFLEFAKKDKETKVITLYIEGLKERRRFFEICREITKTKPIIVLKGGKSQIAKKAVLSHTASLAGEKEIFSAMFKQAKILEVESLEELFDLAKALAWQRKCKNNIAIVTNGGGAGILCADYCEELGLKLAKLSQKTLKILSNSLIMHPAFSRSNPLDIVGDALADRYKLAINTLLKQKNIYGLIVIQTLQIMTKPLENAKIIIEAQKQWKDKPVVTVFMGGEGVKEAINLLENNKIPNYPDPKRAAMAIKALIVDNSG